MHSRVIVQLAVLVGSVLGFIPAAAHAASDCTHYASPTGTGNGLSVTSPFKISSFWSLAGPGKTLCLADGNYTGTSSMILPPANLNGTSLAPITIKAINDGAVTIDGQNVMNPLILANNDWFVIEGINVKQSSGTVVLIKDGADNNTIRRVAAWDGTGAVFGANNNEGNVFEDVAGFGTGRKIFSTQGGNGATFRRAWGIWQYSEIIGPKSTFQIGYNSANDLCENCIGSWVTTQSPIDQPTSVFRNGAGVAALTNNRYLGSIAYLKSAGSADMVALAFATNTLGSSFQNVVLYSAVPERPVDARAVDVTLGGPCTDCTIANTTEIGGISSSLSSEWSVSNRVDANTVAEAPNIWDAPGSSGARVCKRYADGALTSVPLWPWPMDQRIRTALLDAGKDPDALFGSIGGTVTTLMESMFGTIPAECRSGSSSIPVTSLPSAPTNLKIIP